MTCLVGDCYEPVRSMGRCVKHYNQWRTRPQWRPTRVTLDKQPPCCVCPIPDADATGECRRCHRLHRGDFADLREAWRLHLGLIRG